MGFIDAVEIQWRGHISGFHWGKIFGVYKMAMLT